MLIDYINIAQLPHTVVWLDWHFYAHRLSLFVCLALTYVHYMTTHHVTTITGYMTVLLTGVCMWYTYLAIRYGYSVG